MQSATDGPPAGARRILSDKEFIAILQPHVRGLLQLARFATEEDAAVNRPLLNSAIARTNRSLEVLDSCGARGNRTWFPFRVRLAALRNLALAAHEMLHVRHATPNYHLLNVSATFAEETRRAIAYLERGVRCVLAHLLLDARKVGLALPEQTEIQPDRFAESMPPGQLARDREERHSQSPGEHIVSLATRYLEVEAQSRFLDAVVQSASPWQELIPVPLSEESMRHVMSSFHNLQSEYDTFVGDSETEAVDSDLLMLRGHASLVLHLFRIGSTLAHFYERHMRGNPETLFCCQGCLLAEDTFRWVLFDYCVGHGRRFAEAAVPLAHRILAHYEETVEVEVPIPRYHGFHVRPSTYISQIIRHYGSKATMVMAGTEYDPSSILELFRANELIQKWKRERICALVAARGTDRVLAPNADVATEIRRVLLDLAARGHIVIHNELSLGRQGLDPAQPFFELIAGAVFHLLRTGGIDISTDLTATFRGDKRVLRDIQILAENGYGEDERGNNRPMPPELEYLQHTRMAQN